MLTVLNEASTVGHLLDDLLAQDQPAAEIVVVDGGSTDETAAIVRQRGVRLIVEPGANISRGRNRAIAAAQHDIVAVTDAGVRLKTDWLRLIVAPLREGTAEVVAGFFEPDPHSLFEAAMGATVLPALADVDPATFLPSSRSIAFRREAWQRVGGYPEWLDYCEDLIFDLKLRSTLGIRMAFEPCAVVRFRPRSNLRAFFRQYYRYARGDGKADLWRKRHALRYASYAYLLVVLALSPRRLRNPHLTSPASGRGIVLRWPAVLAAATLGGAGMYLRGPVRRLLASRGAGAGGGDCPPKLLEWLSMLALVPVIRLTGDVAKMAGYPAGWLWRISRRPGDWRQ